MVDGQNPPTPHLYMIRADLHSHTCYSHAKNTPQEMYAAAVAKGLDYLGFTEHSPRPDGYDYTHEYRERLNEHLPDYVREVRELKNDSGPCKALFAMEIDWLGDESEFVKKACEAFPFDYLLGSVHFLKTWGFDDISDPWDAASQEECEIWYDEYFTSWKVMIESGLFQIASHPDLIKIYSVDQFHVWLDKPRSRALIESGLMAMRDRGMAMEISSAGLRKPCGEIYPAPMIMQLAAKHGLAISLASDAHNIGDVGAGFSRLATYAHAFGFNVQTIFENGNSFTIPF